MTDSSYEIIIVGGGIQGAGIAQAAAAAGYRVLLLEKQAPAAGTSSRSSKLIHGGLRYLESGQFRLVWEAIRERERLLRLAPDLVRYVPFLIPVYAKSLRRPWQIRAGLCVYALLAGFKPQSRFHAIKKTAWRSLGGLRQEGLRAVFSYPDAQTDDTALTRAVLASAAALGAHILYPARFVSAARTSQGYRIEYVFNDQSYSCCAQVLVNAGGPWVNRIQDRISPAPAKLEVELVQGTHLHFDQPLSSAIFYGESPRDRRPVFIMPWRQGTLVGTTETVFSGDPNQVEPLPEEIAYLKETLQFYFPHYSGRLIGSMAGLRVLPQGSGKPFHRSRETVLVADENQRPHLIAVYGGKLTTYRATAARIMRLMGKTLPRRTPIAYTDRLPLTANVNRILMPANGVSNPHHPQTRSN